jgi:hypothetical protein
MVGVEYIDEYGIFAPFVRSEIPRTEFTYDNAIKNIIRLNSIYEFDYIYVDAGHGESQIEQLKLYGIANPETGLDKKIVRVNFSQKVTMIDPVTKVKEKKDIKPFMVNNTVLLFERNQFAFNPDDKKMLKQFENYHVERFGINGRPMYGSEDEHIHDCVILAIHGFTMKYNSMMQVRHASLITKLDVFRNTDDNVKTRNIKEKENKLPVEKLYKAGGPLLASLKGMGTKHSVSRGLQRYPTRRSF